MEDTAVAILRFKSGALGVIEAATSVYPEFERRLEISGDKGSIVLEGYNNIKKWHFNGEKDSASEIEDKKPAWTHSHALQIEEFADAILKGRQPEVSPIEARKSVEIILAIYRSSKEKKEIKLPL